MLRGRKPTHVVFKKSTSLTENLESSEAGSSAKTSQEGPQNELQKYKFRSRKCPGSISLCERLILNQASITLKNIINVDSSIIKGRDHIHMFRPKDHLARYLHDIIA